MNRTVLTWVVFILPLALGLFYVKHMVQNLEDELTGLQKSIEGDEDEVHVLRAEWTYLSRPDRVKNLASKYLDLAPADGTQMADVNSIPLADDTANMMASYQRVER